MVDIFTNAIAYEEMMGRWSARLAPLFANFAKIITMDIKECNQNPTLSKVYTLLNVG